MSSKEAQIQNSPSDKELIDEIRALKDEVQNLKARLGEAEELRRAISEWDLDALVIPGPEGDLVFTLDSADRAYRVLVETMDEGTATIGCDGTILYCNRHLAELFRMPSQDIVGSSIYRFIAPDNKTTFNALLSQKKGKGELNLLARGGIYVPVYLSVNSLQVEKSPDAWCLVVTDLTEQKKNEKIISLAQSVIEQVADIIVVCDNSGSIIRFSKVTSEICGCNPAFQRFEDIIELRSSEREDTGERVLPVTSALRGYIKPLF